MPATTLCWRPVRDEAVELRDLERAANLVGLAHVYDPLTHPFPDEAVLEHWRRTLADPEVVVEVVEDPDQPRLLAYVARDSRRLRHLAVHPDAWGAGLGTAGASRAAAAIGPGAVLWVLEANERARALYERLGWSANGRTQPCPWSPFPLELEYEFGGNA